MSLVWVVAIIVAAAVLGWSLVGSINVRRKAFDEEPLTKAPFIFAIIAFALVMALMLLIVNNVALVALIVSFIGMFFVLVEADRNIGVVSRRLGNNPSGMLSFRVWIHLVAFTGAIWVLSVGNLIGWANLYTEFGLALWALIWAPPLICAAIVYYWAKRTDDQEVRTLEQTAQSDPSAQADD